VRGRKPTPPSAVVAAEAKAKTSDPDSRILRDGIAYVQGYNAQAAVAEGQIIVAAELVQDTNDRHQLTPMLAKTEETLAAIGHDEQIGVCLADAGYWDTDALEAIVERGQRLIVNPDTSNAANASPTHRTPTRARRGWRASGSRCTRRSQATKATPSTQHDANSPNPSSDRRRSPGVPTASSAAASTPAKANGG